MTGRLKNSSIGHERWAKILDADAPKVMHFLGQQGIGRRKFARELHFRVNGNHSDDDYTYMMDPKVDEVRALELFATIPAIGVHRTAVIELTQPYNRRAIDRLTQLLDDPQHLKIILLSEEELPEVLATRAARYPFHPLSDEQLQQLLEERGLPTDFAMRYAALAEGNVRRAMQIRDEEKPKALVMQFVSAVAELDRHGIGQAFAKWDNRKHTRLLRSWLQESLTGRWMRFLPEDDRSIPRPDKMSLLAATSRKQAVARLKRTAEDITRGGTGV